MAAAPKIGSNKFIDVGDRVIITDNTNNFGTDNLAVYRGQHGIVVHTDGFGRCVVRLDGGVKVIAWNVADMVREETPPRRVFPHFQRAIRQLAACLA